MKIDSVDQPRLSRNELLMRAMACDMIIDLLQAERSELQSILALLEQGPAPKVRRSPPRKGRPLVTTQGKSGWPDDPAERSKEMRRRQKKARKNRAAKLKRATPAVKLQAA